MKKLAAILCLCAMATGAFAQGVVNFANSATTLVSLTANGTSAAIPAGSAGSYYFALLVANPGTTDPKTFTFTGNYATNSVAAGRFVLNGAQVPAASWGPGVTKAYEIAGWASSLGATFNPAWLTTAPNGAFGLSAIGTGAAGGTDAAGNALPPYPLFGGTGITSGFALQGSIPEPSSMALAGLGAAALLIFRRRK